MECWVRYDGVSYQRARRCAVLFTQYNTAQRRANRKLPENGSSLTTRRQSVAVVGTLSRTEAIDSGSATVGVSSGE